MTLKIDFINKAYSLLRISGLTVQPTPEDVSLALDDLENMASDWQARNICTGYMFELEPDENTPHNVPREFWGAFETSLALKLAPYFGKEPSQSLLKSARGFFATLQSATATVRRVAYPARQPIGSGNLRGYRRYSNYFPPEVVAPNECETNSIYVDDVNDYIESFSAYLKFDEELAGYTVTSTSNITIASHSMTSPEVFYRMQASDTPSNLEQVKIVVTTSEGRTQTRIVNFIVQPSDIE